MHDVSMDSEAESWPGMGRSLIERLGWSAAETQRIDLQPCHHRHRQASTG